jgi:hypothetical protein
MYHPELTPESRQREGCKRPHEAPLWGLCKRTFTTFNKRLLCNFKQLTTSNSQVNTATLQEIELIPPGLYWKGALPAHRKLFGKFAASLANLRMLITF